MSLQLKKRTLTWQDAVVDLSKDSIQKGDQTIFLSKTEMIILEILITKKSNRFERYNYHCIMG